jgi:hypothetical protein
MRREGPRRVGEEPPDGVATRLPVVRDAAESLRLGNERRRRIQCGRSTLTQGELTITQSDTAYVRVFCEDQTVPAKFDIGLLVPGLGRALPEAAMGRAMPDDRASGAAPSEAAGCRSTGRPAGRLGRQGRRSLGGSHGYVRLEGREHVDLTHEAAEAGPCRRVGDVAGGLLKAESSWARPAQATQTDRAGRAATVRGTAGLRACGLSRRAAVRGRRRLRCARGRARGAGPGPGHSRGERPVPP